MNRPPFDDSYCRADHSHELPVSSRAIQAELFFNGHSHGRKKRGPGDYRLRWDDVRYAPGEVKVIAYKNGQRWAEAVQRTADAPAQIALTPDRVTFRADGTDLVYVTIVNRDNRSLSPRQRSLQWCRNS